MSAEILKIAIPAIVLLALVLVAVYYIIRFMRGSIKITLAKNSFNEGEQITGSFELTTRKEIEGNRLYVMLVGKEVTKERRGDKTRTHTREIYRDEVTIEDAKTFSAGQTMNYDFQLATPSSSGSDFLSSPLGKTLKVGMDLLGGRRSYLKWVVEARLDAKGVDLASRKKITVNMSKIT
jgi:predicted small secreted protein